MNAVDVNRALPRRSGEKKASESPSRTVRTGISILRNIRETINIERLLKKNVLSIT